MDTPISFSSGAGSYTGGLTYIWSFGDGTAAVRGQQVQHSFAATGSFTRVLLVFSANSGTELAVQPRQNYAKPQMHQERYTAMLRKDRGKVSTSAALAMFIIGVIAIAGAAALLIFRPSLKKNDGTVQASAIPFAARLDKADGDIGIARQTRAQRGNCPQGCRTDRLDPQCCRMA